MIDVEAVFEKYEDEILTFSGVENKLSARSDLHAFILLDKLVPSSRYMVSAAEHDEIYLDVEIEDLQNSAITEEQIRELVCCGVHIYDGYLHMFV